MTATLTVRIVSFSFKKGIPVDTSGNGGGFVFDCRAIPNPGIYEEYKQSTGMDSNVISYLEQIEATDIFVTHTQKLVSQSVERYLERGFTNLLLCFGCTGGQHRSVYFTERMGKYLQEKYPIQIIIEHREQGVNKILSIN